MILIFCTCKPEEADKITDHLLEKKLIACVNIVPGVKSKYFWEGKLCTDQETILFMETKKELKDKVMAELRSVHSYTVPKIVIIDPAGVNSDYLAWLSEVTN